MELNDGRVIELSDAFMADPFLSLDSDLDDVSEVIRSNMVGEVYDGVTRYGSAVRSTTVAVNSFGSLSERGGTATSCNTVNTSALTSSTSHEMYDKEERNKQIGHIVSLLQDDSSLLQQPCTSQVPSVDVKPNLITTKTAVQQLSHDALDTAARLQAYEQQNHLRLQQQEHQQPVGQQQFFIDPHSSDVNFAALHADSAASSPLDKRDYSHFAQPFATHTEGATFMTHSPDEFANQTASGYSITMTPMLFDGGTFDAHVMDQEEMLLGSMHDSSMLHLGLSDEMLHAASLNNEINNAPYGRIHTHATTSSYANSNSNSMPSPSLSDLFPAGDVFPAQPPSLTLSSGGGESVGASATHFYLDETSSSPPHTLSHTAHHPGVEQQHFFGASGAPQSFSYPSSQLPTQPMIDCGKMSHALNGDLPSDAQMSDDSDAQNSKGDLIRMLLEMSHIELETLRLSRNNSAVEICANAARSKLQRQHQKASTASLPPLDSSSPSLTSHAQGAAALVARPTKEPVGRRNATKRKTPAKKQSAVSVPEKFTLLVGQTPTAANCSNDSRSPIFEIGTMPYFNFIAKSEESDDETDTEQTGHAAQAATSDGNSVSATGSGCASPIKRGPKTERRTAHNLIEKKYRCSINDRINHLKRMLASDETKLSKSATLRKAIEHINTLRAQNSELSHENRQLRALLDTAGISPDSLLSQSSSLMLTNFSDPLPHISTAAGVTSSSSEDSSPVSASPPAGVRALLMPAAKALRVATATVKSSKSNNNNQHKNISNNKNSGNRSALFAPPSQKVTLCIFMFVMVAFNPLSFFISSNAPGQDVAALAPHVYAHHRTLRSADSVGGGFAPFNYASASEFGVLGNATFWLNESTIRRCFVWFLNLLIVAFVLMRLFIYTEPVADGQSAAWHEFLAAKQRARLAITTRNYREAQRQLCDALAIIGREIPVAGSVDELFSVTWQIVRHLLNSVWVGRWLARRRRSDTQPSAAVCRSHAATALVYHQVHQLHLIGVNGVELSELGSLNLALAAVNLAESAGISRHGISHRIRADIYVNAALRAKFTCRYFGTLSYTYFMRRAKRHVRKAQMVDGADVRSLQWIFHPLGQKFLKSHKDAVTEILRSSRRPLNFPFSDAQISPKPTECLTNAFKMHLLALLARQLSALNASSRGTLTDFVEISHFLLEICTSIPTPPATTSKRYREDSNTLDWCGSDNSTSCDDLSVSGDELCTWWTHLITGGLYWRHGDNAHAQKHYAIVRRCPKRLLNNDLALSTGLAFCARKMCFDDRTKKNFTEMVWIHAQRSFHHLERDNFPTFVHKNVDIVAAIQKCCRAITCEWIMTSLLDVWNSHLHANRPCWQHYSPQLVRKLYNATYRHFESCGEYADKKKLVAFKVMEKGVDWSNISSDTEHDQE